MRSGLRRGSRFALPAVFGGAERVSERVSADGGGGEG